MNEGCSEYDIPDNVRMCDYCGSWSYDYEFDEIEDGGVIVYICADCRRLVKELGDEENDNL